MNISCHKLQYPSGAERYTLSTRYTLSIYHGFAIPDMCAYINPNGTVVRTDAALHTFCGIGFNMAWCVTNTLFRF